MNSQKYRRIAPFFIDLPCNFTILSVTDMSLTTNILYKHFLKYRLNRGVPLLEVFEVPVNNLRVSVSDLHAFV